MPDSMTSRMEALEILNCRSIRKVPVRIPSDHNCQHFEKLPRRLDIADQSLQLGNLKRTNKRRQENENDSWLTIEREKGEILHQPLTDLIRSLQDPELGPVTGVGGSAGGAAVVFEDLASVHQSPHFTGHRIVVAHRPLLLISRFSTFANKVNS